MAMMTRARMIYLKTQRHKIILIRNVEHIPFVFKRNPALDCKW